MIHGTDALAFSMHANKGVYVLLLGSGVSRAARIPTGWEITLELVRKVAALEGSECGNDPAAWFRQSRNEEPDYSKLLASLAKTPSERQQLLRPYWEPNDQEREEGAKLPTKAHRAIAELVRLGYVRVILTTNFDRLLETALQDVGVQPTVLSTPDHIDGALPLIHTPCTIVKVHGDYLDTRIRNTPAELEAYPKQLNRLLDRIFDEFGLVIAGWSADWDDALRAAMTRAPYRRFSTYWTCRGELSPKAADLAARKGATVVRVADADSFFESVARKVQALDEFSRPHPLSAEVAVATVKKYLTEDKYRIALDDLLAEEVSRLRASMATPLFDINKGQVNATELEQRVGAYEAASETIVRIAFVAGAWAEPHQLRPWLRALSAVGGRESQSGYTFWIELQSYPASLFFHAFGLGATLHSRWHQLAQLFATAVQRSGEKPARAVEVFPPGAMFDRGLQAMALLPGREREYTPLNNRIADLLGKLVGRSFSSKDELETTFDQFELLAALGFALSSAQQGERYWVPPGRFGWRRRSGDQFLAQLKEELSNRGDESGLVTSGLLGTSAAQALEGITQLEGFLPKLRWH